MKKSFMKAVIGSAAAIMLVATVSSCATPMAVTEQGDADLNKLYTQIDRDRKFIDRTGALPPDLNFAACYRVSRAMRKNDAGHSTGVLGGAGGYIAAGGGAEGAIVGTALAITGYFGERAMKQSKLDQDARACTRQQAASNFIDGKKLGTRSRTIPIGGALR